MDTKQKFSLFHPFHYPINKMPQFSPLVVFFEEVQRFIFSEIFLGKVTK